MQHTKKRHCGQHRRHRRSTCKTYKYGNMRGGMPKYNKLKQQPQYRPLTLSANARAFTPTADVASSRQQSSRHMLANSFKNFIGSIPPSDPRYGMFKSLSLAQKTSAPNVASYPIAYPTAYQTTYPTYPTSYQTAATAASVNTPKCNTEAVALDCEMVIATVKDKDTSVLAHVVIVDFEGNQIYNKYVIPSSGINSIKYYLTQYSGVKEEHLRKLNKNTHAFKTVKREVHGILYKKFIVGHGLDSDFAVLGFNSKKAEAEVWDTAKIDFYKQNTGISYNIHGTPTTDRGARKLRNLVKEILHNNIQTSNRTGHSPLEDARASMNLYRVSCGYPKITNISTHS